MNLRRGLFPVCGSLVQHCSCLLLLSSIMTRSKIGQVWEEWQSSHRIRHSASGASARFISTVGLEWVRCYTKALICGYFDGRFPAASYHRRTQRTLCLAASSVARLMASLYAS
jgi:hypothetical protein